ncbi:MAG TPA: M17 family peptidase N-terminal domain-containing protein, partial [Gaiellaceae bacterium]|nr:M17 family peptidase N-terminal domain-containing protein [Gaiellaceae bacterium]
MTAVPIEITGDADTVGVLVARGLPDGLDAGLRDRLAPLLESGELRGDRAEALVVHGSPRIVAAGLGPRGQVDAERLRTAAGAAAQALARVGGSLAWRLDPSLPVPLAEQAAALVEGTVLGGYSPGAWKTQEPERAPRAVDRIAFAEQEVQEAAERAALLAERANRARDLANMPPNELTPHVLGEKAKELAREHEHLTCDVLATRELDELGMGALTAVGRGSRNEPRLIVLRYEPPEARDGIVLGFVGKSITFDTGGISLKPGAKMEDMKGDMAGGAGTLHGIGAIAALKLPVRAIALLAAAENMPGGDA